VDTSPETPETETLADSLTDKQAAFVVEYLRDFNATQAAIRAGYSEDSAGAIGWELLKKLEIQAGISAAVEARTHRTEIDVDYVVQGAREVFERCMQRRPVMVKQGRTFVQATDDEGRHVWQFDAKGANGALALLAKHVRLGGPDVTLNVDLDTLTPSQLEHIANGGSLATLPVA
jgi:phage terminase small subunit